MFEKHYNTSLVLNCSNTSPGDYLPVETQQVSPKLLLYCSCSYFGGKDRMISYCTDARRCITTKTTNMCQLGNYGHKSCISLAIMSGYH